MNDSFKGGDSGTPAVEVVVRPKVPARKPDGQVISHAEKPNEGEVGEGNDTRTIRHVPQDLLGQRAKAALQVSMRE